MDAARGNATGRAASLPGTGPLLERDDELAALRGAVEDARRGAGGAVVVRGPAGSGKSSLLRAASEYARATGLWVRAARGRALERRVPLGVALDLLAEPVARIDPQGRRRLLDGVAGWAGPLFEDRSEAPASMAVPDALLVGLCRVTLHLAAGGPLLVVVDDLHWADGASLRYLGMLADRVQDAGVALVVALRDEEPRDDVVVPDTFGDGHGATILRPRALSPDAVGVLVTEDFPAAGAEVVAAVVHSGGGNPFFTRELLSCLHERRRGEATPPSAAEVEHLVPAGVLRSVVARADALPRDCRALMTAVAVLGDGVPLRRAAAQAGLNVDAAGHAADGLAGAGLLFPGAPLTITHPLIATAVLAELPAFALGRAHRRAAAVLASDAEPPEKIAAHLLLTEADGTPGTIEVLRAAAAVGLARGDVRTAVRLLRRALAEPLAPATRGALLLELAGAQLAAGDVEADTTLGEALRLAEHGAVPFRVQALGALAQTSLSRGDLVAAAGAAASALDLLDPTDPARPAATADYLLAATFAPGTWPAVERRLEGLLHAVLVDGAVPEHPGLLAHLAFRSALRAADPVIVRRLAALAQERDPLVDPGPSGAAGLPVAFVVRAHLCQGDLAAARLAADGAVTEARRRGVLLALGTASYHRALAYVHLGALTRALADVEAARSNISPAWSGGAAWAAALRAEILLERGDPDAARAALRSDGGEAADSMGQTLLRLARARLALVEHDPRTAHDLACSAGEELWRAYHLDHPMILPWRGVAALGAARSGDRARARELADDALARARATTSRPALGAALRIAGLVRGPRPDPDVLAEAVAVLGDTDARLEQAHALADLGAAHRRAGHRTAARRPLREALDLAERLPSRSLADVVRTELRLVGLRPRRTRLTGIDALTPAEQRVALLALHGHTNPHIAEILSVTTKTVETHLARAYRKLEISGRRQLQAAFGGSADVGDRSERPDRLLR